nr:MAG TPA: hypothetical protein [Bacteriophage sp.]
MIIIEELLIIVALYVKRKLYLRYVVSGALVSSTNTVIDVVRN